MPELPAKNSILTAIRDADVPPVRLIPKEFAVASREKLADLFSMALKAAGGSCIACESESEVRQHILETWKSVPSIGSTCFSGDLFEPITEDTPIAVLSALDLFVCRGRAGVAENGAVWLSEREMGHRASVFLAQHLVLVIKTDDLLPTMHHAYENEPVTRQAGFGLWVAGPSKTADIEQSLVIGAHGARSSTVYLCRE